MLLWDSYSVCSVPYSSGIKRKGYVYDRSVVFSRFSLAADVVAAAEPESGTYRHCLPLIIFDCDHDIWFIVQSDKDDRQMIVLKLFLALFLSMAAFTFYWWYKCRNPYKLEMVIGKKGSGKTTDIQRRTFDGLARGWTVYSSTPVAGARLFDPKTLAMSSLPENSLVLIDEAGIIWHNRDYKNFGGDMKNYFKLQRHYKHKVVLYSQSWDVDKVLRELCDTIWIMKNYFGCYSISRHVIRTISVISAKDMRGEGHIADDLQYDPLIFFWCGAVRFTFIPKYMPFFDSYEVEEKPRAEYKELPIPDVKCLFGRPKIMKLQQKEKRKRSA